MSTFDSCQLTTKDYTILEVVRDRHPMRDETFWAILQRKISTAVVMFREDIPPNVVTLNSRVAYRVNDGPAETRIIAHDQMRGLVGMLLPITNLRGLALLGLAEGESISIPTADGRLETLTVLEVVYQPEAARRERLKLAGASEPRRPREPGLRVVHRSDEPLDKPRNEVAAAFDVGFDDPGPSAA
ncbi:MULTISPECIES: nucleoside-diphosphate kinase [unclassified Mesorhizobium]|uniref:nucleoside-diphosphate kinase n=1 Tax=unclassified Mesorhizobium TaxID=325217 RepID=UPI000FD783F5|nr:MULTISPECIES: nucleoside-diphosphate kinase [unclassified Mesorhizobium]TGT71956.1 nucleoside-diphosphate kinase [Mesorhizobium sp. M2E.F.Ca.ET.166.01.1.1]TGV99329.1 nucleoside-diphosphate kinase [Mesorhizobium sp. M2E.F.Ca.ET.154.01.1.1]